MANILWLSAVLKHDATLSAWKCHSDKIILQVFVFLRGFRDSVHFTYHYASGVMCHYMCHSHNDDVILTEPIVYHHILPNTQALTGGYVIVHILKIHCKA
jgi:hypothetical protein